MTPLQPHPGVGSGNIGSYWEKTCPCALQVEFLDIAGPTGVGKSAVALSLGQKLGGAIVSADSVQIYSGLDIGANKPSTAEQELVPHYLLDVADPATEGWTAPGPVTTEVMINASWGGESIDSDLYVSSGKFHPTKPKNLCRMTIKVH